MAINGLTTRRPSVREKFFPSPDQFGLSDRCCVINSGFVSSEIHAEKYFLNIFKFKQNLDYDYSFSIDLDTNWILFCTKSIGKLWLQSKFDLINKIRKVFLWSKRRLYLLLKSSGEIWGTCAALYQDSCFVIDMKHCWGVDGCSEQSFV